MRIHKKKDGEQLKTKLQWMREGYRVKKDAVGEVMWTNTYTQYTATYYTRQEVRKSAKAAREYKERERKIRKEAELKRRREKERLRAIEAAKQPNLPIPADALQPCDLPDYAGWATSHKPAGKAIMIVDTETSGLDSSWHSILQLSWEVVDTATWEVLSRHNYYFRHPANWERVADKAIQVNGLTQEHLEELGTTHIKAALCAYKHDLEGVDLIVGHNLSFDLSFIFSVFLTLKNNTKDDIYDIQRPDPDMLYCTMQDTTDLCQLPSHRGDGYKWPRLSELADHLEIDYSDLALHDSSADVELTKRCLRRLTEIGHVSID